MRSQFPPGTCAPDSELLRLRIDKAGEAHEDEAAAIEVVQERLDVEEPENVVHSGIVVETHVEPTRRDALGTVAQLWCAPFPVYDCTACTPQLPRIFWARLPKRVRWAITSPLFLCRIRAGSE